MPSLADNAETEASPGCLASMYYTIMITMVIHVRTAVHPWLFTHKHSLCIKPGVEVLYKSIVRVRGREPGQN